MIVVAVVVNDFGKNCERDELIVDTKNKLYTNFQFAAAMTDNQILLEIHEKWKK